MGDFQTHISKSSGGENTIFFLFLHVGIPANRSRIFRHGLPKDILGKGQ